MTADFEEFCDRLEALIDEYRAKPMDDRLSYAEYVAALEFTKHKLLNEANEIETT